MAYISKITDLDGSTYDLKSKVTNGILYGEVDSTSTATAFTAQIPGITEYYEGLTILLRNGVVTSASGFTIDINDLGGKPSYSNMALGNPITPTNPTRDTTIFNINYAMIFVYNTTVVDDGCWICYIGYDANTNTIGYQLRTNSSSLPASEKFYRYRLLFTSADGSKWVPANTSTSTNATASRTVNQTPIDPHGAIVYYGTTTAIEANATVTAARLWQQYTLTLGYSFNRTGAALVLPYPKPIYIKATPQANGSAIIDPDTPYVFALPNTDDGKIYIFLGRTYSATSVELVIDHPVYYYKDGAIRLWTNSAASAQIDISTNRPTGKSIATINSNDILAYDVVEVDIQSLTDITLGEANAIDLGSNDAYTSIFGALIGKQDIWLKCLIFDVASEEITCRLPFISSLPTEDIPMYVFGGIVMSLDADFYNVFIGISGATAVVLIKKVQESLTFDSTPTSGSTNPVTSDGIYTALEGKQDTLYFDTVPTLLSSNPVTSGGVYDALEGKQDTLTIDSAPTSGSDNPVTSGGVYTALEDKPDLLIVEATEVSGESYYTLNKTFLEIASSIMQGKYVIIRTIDVVYHFTTYGYVFNQVVLAFGGAVIYDSTIFEHVFVVMQNGTGMIINNATSLVSSVNGSTGDVVLSIPTATSDLTNDSGFITNSAIANMQTTGNLVTSMSSSSTDTQYPSAKLMYDTVGNLESLLAAI